MLSLKKYMFLRFGVFSENHSLFISCQIALKFCVSKHDIIKEIFRLNKWKAFLCMNDISPDLSLRLVLEGYPL